MEMPVRVASLEYLGLVAARLRKDSVHSRANLATMDAVVRDITAEEEKDGNQTGVNITIIHQFLIFKIGLLICNSSNIYRLQHLV